MEREILFRGKLSHSKEWIEGNLIIAKNSQPYIIPFDILEPDGHHLIIDSDNPFWVISKTVGQFTGLCDKNGVKIFNGDILTVETENPMIVGWHSKFASFVLNRDGWAFSHWFGESCNPENCVVIGNIHDNPELLKND